MHWIQEKKTHIRSQQESIVDRVTTEYRSPTSQRCICHEKNLIVLRLLSLHLHVRQGWWRPLTHAPQTPSTHQVNLHRLPLTTTTTTTSPKKKIKIKYIYIYIRRHQIKAHNGPRAGSSYESNPTHLIIRSPKEFAKISPLFSANPFTSHRLHGHGWKKINWYRSGFQIWAAKWQLIWY